MFDEHLAPADDGDVGLAGSRHLAESLVQLHITARHVLGAAFDAAVSRHARERLGRFAPG